MLPQRKNKRLNFSFFWVFLLGLIVGTGLVENRGWVKRVLALTESTHTMPTDTAFNASGYDDDSGLVAVGSTEVALAKDSNWWDLSWRYRRQITVKNLGSTEVNSGTTAQIALDLDDLGLGTTKVQADLDDVRMVYSVGATHTEISRSYSLQTGATNVASLSFPLQAQIGVTAVDSNYYVYYGNVGASAPSGSGYDIGGTQATLVCPFNGSTTCVDGETPTTETGAIRYSGAKSALSFDGADDYLTISNPLSLQNLPNGDFTVEAWYYQKGGDQPAIIQMGSGSNWWRLYIQYYTKPHFYIVTSGTPGGARSDSTNTYNTWHHIAGTYDSTTATARIFVDGQEVSYTGTNGYQSSPTGTYSDSGDDLYIGAVDSGSSTVNKWKGLIDEVRISDTVRYTENFTPQTEPFEPDANTKLLLHFDENGDDPRNSGKAIDASGNGNHGTINGAKYVAGLVGVDGATSDTGKVTIQPYAGHQGIFIEEGTTNLVPNPSFEHATYNIGWSLPYFNLGTGTTTFTAGIAKRNGGGPFAEGVMVQGEYGSTSDFTADRVYTTGGIGNQLAGDFYEYFDGEQGSVTFWVTTEYSSDVAVVQRYVKSDYFVIQRDGAELKIQKSKSPWTIYTVGTTMADWSAGETHQVTFRWMTRGTFDGINYWSLSVDDVHVFDQSTLVDFGREAGTGVSLGDAKWYPAAVIEGLTVYRRPLFDGTYGIDVGNGDEIEQIYNSGSGKDPTLITGSWDVVFALPTNASTGSLGGTGQAWSHPHSSNVLYTDTTNTGGFMMNGTYTDDGWHDVGTPSNIAGMTAPEKIYAGGYEVTSDAANEGIGYTLTGLTAGQNYVVRALAHSDGTSIPKVQIWDDTNDAEITSLTGTVGSGRTAPDVLLFTFELPTTARYGVAADSTAIEVRLLNTQTSGTVYWHQIELLENLVDNPSVEVGSSATGEWIPTGWSSTVQDGESNEELTTVHSGSKAVRIVSSNLQWRTIRTLVPFTNKKFYGGGFWGKLVTGSCQLWGEGYYKRPQHREPQTYASIFNFTSMNSGSDYSHSGLVVRADSTRSNHDFGLSRQWGGVEFYFDDTYFFQLDDVSLTVTAASQENSSEDTGLRVDGADTLTQAIDNVNAYRGSFKFKMTPRHSFGVGSSFGVSQPVIFEAYGDSDDYLKLYKTGDTLAAIVSMAGTTAVANWSSPTLDAGTSYPFVVSYATGSNLVLNVGGTDRATASIGTGVSFGTAPATAYFGSDSSGANQYDCTIKGFESLTPTENTTAPYYKFGSSSAKLTNSGADDSQYAIDVGATGTNTLSAYVYDGTSGNVGGTVDGSVAALFYNNAAIGTTYTDTGGGWWRLTGVFTGIGTTVPAGVEVKAGKTVYVDGVQVEKKSIYTHGTYFTSFADGSLGTGYSWTGTENESSSSRTVGSLVYSATSNANPSSGTVSFWVKPNATYFSTNSSRYFISIGGRVWVSTSGSWGGQWSPRFGVSDGATAYQVSFSFPTVGNWFHYVGVWQENDIRFYVNSVSSGTPITSATMPSSWASDNIQLSGGLGGSVISDLRVYDAALSADQVADLYYQGLMTHQGGSESDDRYPASGTYISPVLDLSANGQWGSTPIAFTQNLMGGTLAYFTRSSADNSVWSDWVAVGVGGSIGSDPRRYLQWKVDMTAPDSRAETPTVTGMTVSYVEDSTAPINPTSTATAYSAGVGTTALTSATWYNYATPYFAWAAGDDQAAEGQSASGVAKYHVFLTQGVGETPVDNSSEGCYAEVLTAEERSLRVGSGDWSSCSLTDGTYYLRLQTEDNSGNVAGPVTLFTYKYDGTDPVAPASVSSTTVGYSATNSYSFYWPEGSDELSGVAGYEYKTGATTGTFSEWQFVEGTTVSGVEAYTEGQNMFYVRSLDNAGNYSATTSNLGVAMFYYNATAPTAPLGVGISPATTESSPSSSNVFTVTWEEPASYSGSIAKYHYCVNCTPSATTMTETTSTETVARALTNVALATQQGKNTFYIVAEDNNTDESTGYGNRNFEAYTSVDFYASTVAPAAPANLTITDSSDRDSSQWRLTLAWDVGSTVSAVPDHYEVYRSTDGSTYTSTGTVSTTAYTDDNLTQSQTYYYKVRAVDNAGSNSLFTSVVSAAPEGKYTSPPAAGGIPSVTAGSSTATVSWTSSRTAYGTVEYGKTSSYGSAASETTAVTSHSIKLTGLSSGTTYHYRIQTLDESALVGYDRSEAYSSDYTFTTLATPEITDVTVDEVGLDTVTISWKTRTTASSTIHYGLTTEYGSSKQISTTASESVHTARLTGLDHSTTYHFRIKGVSVDGDDIESDDYSFTTITFPKVTAYVLKTDQSAGGTTISVAWATNVPTSSVVEYQAARLTNEGEWQIDQLEAMSQAELLGVKVTTRGEPLQISRAKLETKHVMKVESLEDGAVYIIRLKGRDQYGNEAVSEPIRYVTGADTRPPRITDVVVETQMSGSGAASKAQVLVSWETDEPATTQVVYGQGTGADYPLSSPEETDLTSKHTVVLRDLEHTSSYHLKIVSKDKAGNKAESGDLVAVTPGVQESALDVVLKNLEDVFGFLKI